MKRTLFELPKIKSYSNHEEYALSSWYNLIWYKLYQEEIENKIEVADALAIKLLQCLNYMVSTMKAFSQNLSEGIWSLKIKQTKLSILVDHFF